MTSDYVIWNMSFKAIHDQRVTVRLLNKIFLEDMLSPRFLPDASQIPMHYSVCANFPSQTIVSYY